MDLDNLRKFGQRFLTDRVSCVLHDTLGPENLSWTLPAFLLWTVRSFSCISDVFPSPSAKQLHSTHMPGECQPGNHETFSRSCFENPQDAEKRLQVRRPGLQSPSSGISSSSLNPDVFLSKNTVMVAPPRKVGSILLDCACGRTFDDM